MALVPRGSEHVPSPGGQAAPLETSGSTALPVFATGSEELPGKGNGPKFNLHISITLGGFAAKTQPKCLPVHPRALMGQSKPGVTFESWEMKVDHRAKIKQSRTTSEPFSAEDY